MSELTLTRRNVFLLALSQAMFVSLISLVVSTSALVGAALAEDRAYAGLPYAMQLITTMATSIPAAMLMARIGRKASFLIASVIAMLGGSLCTAGIMHQNFYLFLCGSIALGIFTGFGNYYRFTAADSVSTEYKSRAISYVLAGGVVAAFIGPNLANYTRDVISNAAFAGSYAATLVLFALSFLFISFLRLPRDHVEHPESGSTAARPLLEIALQPRFIIAVICGMLSYAVMTLVMTATPLAMEHHAHPFAQISFVIQWHVLGMFVPSFFTGHLIRRFGLLPILFTGVILGLACIALNLQGTTVTHFWLALLLLGISWNFLFIGATTLLTETYQASEKFKAQALNDFLIFSVVACASLAAGVLHHHYGWQLVNYGALPVLTIIFASLIWLYSLGRNSLPQAENVLP